MKKLIIGSALMLAIVFESNAGGPQWQPVTSGMPQMQMPGSNGSSGGSQDVGYQGSSGARYQYDLSNPVDRNRYSTDTSAQIRDQLVVDPSRSMDQARGQNGGGYEGR